MQNKPTPSIIGTTGRMRPVSRQHAADALRSARRSGLTVQMYPHRRDGFREVAVLHPASSVPLFSVIDHDFPRRSRGAA